MTDAEVFAIAQEALMTALLVAAPILIVSLVIGLVVSVFQAITEINEVTLTFVPKIFGVFAVAAVMGPWMVATMVGYTQRLFAALRPRVVNVEVRGQDVREAQTQSSCRPRCAVVVDYEHAQARAAEHLNADQILLPR